MHFRYRDNVIQVIRTTYDKESKRGRSVVVGRLPRLSLAIGDNLRDACTLDELREIEAWVAENQRAEALKSELAAMTLAEQLNRANLWFSANKDSEAAKRLAAEAHFAWLELVRDLRKLELLD